MKRVINIILGKEPSKTLDVRKYTRGKILSGNEVYATVIDVYQNMATVQVLHSRSQLVGLSIIGGNVSIGDIVIVDYSHGTPPFIRSNYTIENEKEQVELDKFNDDYTPEYNPSIDPEWFNANLSFGYGDMTCMTYLYPHYGTNAEYDVPVNTPTLIELGNNDSPYITYSWDSDNMWQYKTDPDHCGTKLYLPKKGKYLVFAHVELWIWSWYGHGATWTSNRWNKIEILHNGTPIASTNTKYTRAENPWQSNQRVDWGPYYEYIDERIECTSIVSAAANDYVEFRLTYYAPETFNWLGLENWDPDSTIFSATLLPGTQSNQ